MRHPRKISLPDCRKMCFWETSVLNVSWGSMPPDPLRGSDLRPSISQSICLLTRLCPSTSKVNKNPALTLLVLVTRWGSCSGLLLIRFGGMKGAVDARVVPFTFITAVAVLALTKGPVTGAIIPWSSEVGWQAAWVKEWRRCGWWLGLCCQTSMEIVKVHAWPVC